jgi:hypothetical protein
MISILSALVIGISAQVSGQTARGGQIQGTVADPEGAVIPNARISVLSADSNKVAADATTDRLGEFKIGILNTGAYIIKIRLQGWRSRALDDVVVREGETTILRDIQLDVVGCDGPGMNCDIFSNDPKDFPPKPLSFGYLKGNLNCEVALRKNQVYCPAGVAIPRRARAMDFKIAKEGARIYLSPMNGAVMSAPNSSKADCSDANFSMAEIRVDGLGPGYDICVRTHEGHPSQVFLVNDVDPTSLEVSLWQVTRRR